MPVGEEDFVAVTCRWSASSRSGLGKREMSVNIKRATLGHSFGSVNTLR